MALKIKHAILHVLNLGANHYSKDELDIDSEICCDFIAKHLRKVMNSAGARDATFKADSDIYEMLRGYQTGELYFGDFSIKVAQKLATIMQDSQDIPPADILIAAFENNHTDYIGIIKLNYIESFAHRVTDEGSNSLVKNIMLPYTSGKVEEACVIPFDPMIIRLLEKPYSVNGNEINYFSELFLQCETNISKKETAEIIQQISDDITTKYFDGDVEASAKIKYALIEESEELYEDDSLILENVMNRAFPQNEEIKAEFVEAAKECGLPHEINLDKSYVKKQFSSQKFKADNGIEIKMPSELMKDPDSFALMQNPDGTITITLKNMRIMQ